MKRLLFALALLALMAVPAPAMAKGPTSATLCGPDGCQGLGDARQLGEYPDGGPNGEMPVPAPYYELRFTSRGDGEEYTWTTWYVPSAKSFASVDEQEGVSWMPMNDPELTALAKRLRPFPAPEITAVTIDSRRVTDNPASYLELFTVQSVDENAYPQGVADWEQVTFVSKQKSPWTMAQSSIHFSPSNGMLQRGIEMLKLPDEMSADLRSGQPLVGDSAGFPWRDVVFAVLAGTALLIAASFIRPLRRRVVVRRAPTTA
jgi:hypothetical protein